jgi:hypothetical protein
MVQSKSPFAEILFLGRAFLLVYEHAVLMACVPLDTLSDRRRAILPAMCFTTLQISKIPP